MNGISSWFRQFSAKLSAGLRSFMAGRYGTDRLNMVILCAGLFCSLLSVWVKADRSSPNHLGPRVKLRKPGPAISTFWK